MTTFAEEIKRAAPSRDEARARRWVYVPYDRLTSEVGPLADLDPAVTGAVFIESAEKALRRPYHKRKLALVLAAERRFALEVAARGARVIYVAGDAPIGEALASAMAARKIAEVTTTRPAERELRKDLDVARARGLSVREVADETWLTTREDFDGAFDGKPPFRMDRFYRKVRARTGILMEKGGQFTGGKVSFDAENRRPWRGDPPVPERPRFAPGPIVREVLDLVERRFPKHFGSTAGFDLPTSRAEAESAWSFALARLLPHFGPFEDAMCAREPDLFHSKISSLLNLSLLLPSRVVRDVEAAHRAGRVPLASAEGFIRQVLGWREFVRHAHEATDGFRTLDPRAAEEAARRDAERAQGRRTDGADPGAAPSALGASRPLPQAYWGEPCGMRCLDTVIADVVREGASHHITRLMILGNLATLLGVSPRALTDWFWFAYTDAYDWVVEPNVLGMATYADGGMLMTKPYVSGAAYISKMSDYCKGCRYDPKRSTGDGACPVTALYWTFLERNRAALEGNMRIAMPLRSVEKKGEAEMRALRAVAAEAVARLGLST